MTRVYYKEAAAAIVVYDSTRAATYEGALRWKADLDQKVRLADGGTIPAILLANKVNVIHFIFDVFWHQKREWSAVTRLAPF